MSQWQQNQHYGSYGYGAETENGHYPSREVFRSGQAGFSDNTSGTRSGPRHTGHYAQHQQHFGQQVHPKISSQHADMIPHYHQAGQQPQDSQHNIKQEHLDPSHQLLGQQQQQISQQYQHGDLHQAQMGNEQFQEYKHQNRGQRPSIRQQYKLNYSVSGYSFDSGNYNLSGDGYESGYAQSTPSTYGTSARYHFKPGAQMEPIFKPQGDFDYRGSYNKPSTSHGGFIHRFGENRNRSYRGRGGHNYGRPRARPGDEPKRSIKSYPSYSMPQPPRKRKEFGAATPTLPPPGTKNPTQLLYELKRGVLFGEYESGLGENQRFKISLTVDGVTFTGLGATKKKAKCDACKRALAQLYDYHYPPDPENTSADIGNADAKKAKVDLGLSKGKTPAMLLHELSDTLEVTFVGYPKVQYARLSDEEKKTICLADDYVCQVVTNGRTATGSGPSKKSAKSRAAESALKEFFDITLPTTPTAATTAPATDTATDAATDTANDAAPNAATDAANDAATDVANDAATDAATDNEQNPVAPATETAALHPVSWLIQYDPAVIFKIDAVEKSQMDPSAKRTSCPFFQCSVTLAGVVHVGAIKPSKKDAKYSAAETAREQVLKSDPQAGRPKKKRKVVPKPASE